MNGFKGIENLSFRNKTAVSISSTASTAAEDNETSKNEVMPDDVSTDTEEKHGPELPLPVPNLF